MSAFPSLAMWLEPLIVLALGAAAVVGLASIAACWTRSGVGRRAVWQAALAALAVLFVAEATGLAGGVSSWLHGLELSGPDAIEPAPIIATLPTPPAVLSTQPSLTRSSDEGDAAASANDSTCELASITWWPGLVWLAGAAIVGGRACLARLLLLIFRVRRRRCTEAEFTGLVGAVAGRLGYRRSVWIVESEGLLSPAAFGIVRPTLALPAGFRTQFTPAQQEAILAHELAHLAAHDPAWHFFAQLVTAALWWHPLAWWALVQFRAATESAADEASLVVADGPGILAACLVQLGTRLAKRRSVGWLSMAGNGFRSGLGQRVERLLRLEGAARRPLGRVRLRLILILGPALLAAAAGLTTAWARSPAIAEGDVPMMSAWKRSVAAVAFVAVLGSADPAPGGQQAEQSRPATGGKTRSPEDPKTLDDQADEVRAQQRDVAAKLVELLKQVKSRDESLTGARDSDAQKIRDELQILNAQVKKLEARRHQLENNLKALTDKKAEDAAVAKQTARIKVFRLKHRDPNELSAVLTALLPHEQPAMGMMDAMGGKGSGMMGGKGGFGGMTGGSSGKGGFGNMMGGGAGAGGGMGMMGGGSIGKIGGGSIGFGRPGSSWRLVADPRTNSLIARGTEDDLRTIGDLIAALDLEDSKTSTKLKNLRTFKLKHADVDQVAAILQGLELKVTVSVLPSAKMLAVSGSEAALKEVGELIVELDVEAKPIKDVKLRQ